MNLQTVICVKRVTLERGGKYLLDTIQRNRSVDEDSMVERGMLGWAFSTQERDI
jgi:hypothetical protein